jgi:hypothetical protein
VRDARRHPARSTVTIALVAFAAFVLVTVSSMKQRPATDTSDKRCGTGGYQLMLRADVPLLGDLSTQKGRNLLGIRPGDAGVWDRASFMPMRSWAGQDISCLNITRPTSPAILGVPQAMVERRAFTFARTIRRVDNPWELLGGGADEDVPVIADEETATYVLKLGLGGTLTITDQLGHQRRLRLVATLAHSIFQSELLMGEGSFVRLFPWQGGFSVVLVEARAGDVAQLRRLLSDELEDFSVTVEPTAERLLRYQDVANTYLSTFQTLGALGLMLGTVGLAVVLLRNLIERKAELALLSAIGFSPLRRLRLVLAENVFLLALGLGVGAACALVGVLPAITASIRAINWGQLGLALAAVLLTGLCVLGLTVWFGGRRVIPADLRAE